MARKTKQVQRIEEMELALDGAAEAVKAFDKALKQFKRAQPGINKLLDYYGSELWFDDMEALENGKLPEDLKCGVLSEDLPYDVFVNYQDIAIRMLESATKALKA